MKRLTSGVLKFFLYAWLGFCAVTLEAREVRGVGATFPGEVYLAWSASYEKLTGKKVNYALTGSGDGRKKIQEGAVDFGASDVPLTQATLEQHKLVQFPTLLGGVVPLVNLPGIGAGQLKLNSALLVDIFLGKIRDWNDPRIVKLNPTMRLSNLKITLVVRADKSGTTEVFTQYLSRVSNVWASSVGESGSPAWPTAVVQAEGSRGVMQQLQRIAGSLTYMSFDIALRDKAAYAMLQNRTGRFVEPSIDGFRWAFRRADPLHSLSKEAVSLIDMEGSNVWPITTMTYILLEREPKTAAAASEAAQFFFWVMLQGDAMARDSGFAPLPTEFQARCIKAFEKIHPRDGQPLDAIPRVPNWSGWGS